jgi:cellulose synthase/poly-beta-1,6-N-acetylglucosamine synthase-like glycosyltransferase
VPALAILVGYGLVVSFWKLLHVLVFFYRPHRYFLGGKAARLQGNDGPRVSIILAAKDEQGNIGDCIRSVLSAEYTNFELIVVDDRSTDGTVAEIEQAAADNPRVRLLRVTDLPAGWTGKMNAVRQGLAVATGSIVLIMDADTRHNPRTLGTALALMERKHVALLSLLPRFDHRSFFSKLVQPAVGTLVMVWKPLPWVNSRKRKEIALGWGGFLMVRRDVLTAVGGVEAIKDRFAADIALVSRVKQARRRIRILHGPDLVATHLYTGPSAIINGWTRLLRITADNRRVLLIGTLLGLWLLCMSAYPMMVVGLRELCRGQFGLTALCHGRITLDQLIEVKQHNVGVALGLMGAMHLLLQITLFGRFYRMSGSNPLYALGHFPAILITGYLTVLALIRTRSMQMNWRGTNYQLGTDGHAARALEGAQ